MANLNTQSFSALVSNFAAAVQGAAKQLIDFSIGSVLLAIDEATAYVSLWLQGLALQIVALTRAATSSGTDLDSWLAQFGFYRLPAVTASGQVTFSRFTSTNQALIPVGTVVQTSDGSVQYTVIADTTNSAYSPSQNGYIVPANTASMTVPAQCTVGGIVGNVLASTITQLANAIPYIDTVTNANPFVNGIDPESDPAARSRFILYIASLEAATLLAVKNAIASVQQGLTDTITENQQYNGSTQYGYFTVIVNDGSGSPPTQLLDSVGSAIDAVRPLCSTFGVHAPTIVTANVSMTITSASGYTHSDVVAQVVAAIRSYIAGLTLGQELPYSILSKLAYDASPGVTNVTSILLNSGTSDLVATSQQVIVAGAVTVS